MVDKPRQAILAVKENTAAASDDVASTGVHRFDSRPAGECLSVRDGLAVAGAAVWHSSSTRRLFRARSLLRNALATDLDVATLYAESLMNLRPWKLYEEDGTPAPSTETIDRVKKLSIYARESVSHVWLINPIARTLEVLQLEGGRWVLLATREGSDMVKAAPFEAVDLALGAPWSGTSEPAP
jgi:hypothetical protein